MMRGWQNPNGPQGGWQNPFNGGQQQKKWGKRN
jgi:hypothetical protein